MLKSAQNGHAKLGTLVLPQAGGTALTLQISPRGRLSLVADADAPALDAHLAGRLAQAFARGPGHGLLRLGAAELGQVMPPLFVWWRDFGTRFVTQLCLRPDEAELGKGGGPPAPAETELAGLARSAPLMSGAEYLVGEVLRDLWREIESACRVEQAECGLPLGEFLTGLHPVWHVVGRVHVHLAENRQDPEAPFAFLATYTHRLSQQGQAQHLPLGQALQEYADASEKEALLSLLLPVQRAAEHCDWLRRLVATGEIYYPLRWSIEEAYQLLSDALVLEQAGVVVRLPASWRSGRPARPQVTATVGRSLPSPLGVGALLDFHAALTLDGEPLNAEEERLVLSASNGLAFIRGQWVELNAARLERALAHFRNAESQAAVEGGLSFIQALRLLAGADLAAKDSAAGPESGWSQVNAGSWLSELLQGLRSPEGLAHVEPGPALRGTLRPYQQAGLCWLQLLSRLGLGACLADDMGLGKTIQVLALLIVQRQTPDPPGRPSLLVAPTTLLANWAAEIARFAPDLKTLIAHASVTPREELQGLQPEALSGLDLVITSYGSLTRLPWLAQGAWNLLILDEAQAIKNPGARQTRALKQLTAQARIALTGTPIENRLGDLWSIFDFLNPGLLGSATEFTHYTRTLGERPNPYGPLRALLGPYILRRLKTDRKVIADLPDKAEVKAWCQLSRKQAVLYQQTVKELAQRLQESVGIQRRGLVLTMLMRLKQICNHPSQWLGDNAWHEDDSGKWARLRELAEVIGARQEKALVFTQFKELTGPLAAHLGGLFGRPGLVLHGATPLKQRRERVTRFQEDESVPFFVLSLKAGGAGLNLTAASHVIHVDRWWNPAVENQATDRAFRIGQTKNVLVHKFICRGTVEEKIDALIESKQALASELLEGGRELNLSEFSNEELLRLVALDLSSARLE